MEIIIIDYGVGNVRSVQKAFEFLGCEAVITDNIYKIKEASVLVVPGQGAFAGAMRNLTNMGLVPYLKEYLAKKRPFLGICLGFQILFEKSFENGVYDGLGVFPGEVKLFDFSDDVEQKKKLKVPHMGWNKINVVNDSNDFYKGLDGSYVYFVHSYYVDSFDKNIISTTTQYGHSYVSSVQSKNLLATQFHPEKSGLIGIKILDNFIKSITWQG